MNGILGMGDGFGPAEREVTVEPDPGGGSGA